MEYKELKKQVSELDLPAKERAVYKKLLAHAGVGGRPWNYYEQHLEEASTANAFFESVYQDDDLKLTEIWAIWAKYKHPEEWVSRFPPRMVLDEIPDKKNLIITSNGSRTFFPQKGIGDSFIVMVLNDGDFNRMLCEYVGAVDGDFRIEGYKFSGSYDIFRDDNLFVLLQWQFDEETGWRIKPAHRNRRDIRPQTH